MARKFGVRSAPLIRALVAPPGCNIGKTLQTLAQQRQPAVLDAPSPSSLLEVSMSNTSALQTLEASRDQILVMPHLERLFLRHEDGLTVLRNLLARIITLKKRVLLDCDSWAWVYLQQAMGIEDMLGEPHTFAPFDADRLDAWLRPALKFQSHDFRQRGDNEAVFPTTDEDTQPRKTKKSTFIASLAARSRGNPGVALALWRASVRTRDITEEEHEPLEISGKPFIWLASAANLTLPELPVDVDRVHRFVLHSVLLHGGIPRALLDTVLPFSGDDIQRRVSGLRRVGVLEECEGDLRVPLTAYPLVRRDLQDEAFLIDAF